MTRTLRLLTSASVLAVAGFAATPAFAAGTTAGSTITNTVTVNYQVGGVAQNAVSATDNLVVDRKINLVVAQLGTTTTSVSPGQTSAVTGFTVTNSSNAVLDFALALTQSSGGTAAHGGTDNFNVSNVKLYLDTDNSGTYNAGDTLITYLDEIAADATKTVFVVSDIPLGKSTGDVANVRLTATAAESGGAGSLGATVTQTSGANTAAMDTVFADTNANNNVAGDGASFAENDYTVLAAALSAVKTSKIISDPINGSTNPKMIPGATVEYCIAVSNGAGSATATSVALSDPLPSQTTYLAAFGIKVNGTVTSGACNADGVAGGSFASNTVSGTLSNVAAGATSTLVFRVTIN
ncbi:MAG TPA: hypothetical protein VGC56_14865 [Allosphingosinicella sp.]|jgi:hypothetical protein